MPIVHTIEPGVVHIKLSGKYTFSESLEAIEQATAYQGRYFVLLGRLSPLDGIGPAELGLDQLAEQLENQPPKEIIIATNPTVEGEATSYYLQRMAKAHAIKVTRIAHGVPLGGELEYTDQSTLAHAFGSRLLIDLGL